MASNVLMCRAMKYIIYGHSMRNVANKLLKRSIATIPSNTIPYSGSANNIDSPPWSVDPNLPLPGNIGVDLENLDDPTKNNYEEKHKYQSLAGALLQLESENFRKSQVIQQYISKSDAENEEECYISVNGETSNKVECRIETCPPMLKKGFLRLFSEMRNPEDDLTVISISQETINDMSVWSEEVEEERDKLLSTFIETASDIVRRIEECGYWADFIDPSSGQAYNGEHRSETLFETDDRFIHLGFRIEDLGCCKAIAHKQWGTYVFVGVLFTNAPIKSHVFSSICQKK